MQAMVVNGGPKMTWGAGGSLISSEARVLMAGINQMFQSEQGESSAWGGVRLRVGWRVSARCSATVRAPLGAVRRGPPTAVIPHPAASRTRLTL